MLYAGIKANVSAFGGDQFDPEIESERKAMESFFSLFYMGIQLGSLVAGFFPMFMQVSP